jgi:hypothetical protein
MSSRLHSQSASFWEQNNVLSVPGFQTWTVQPIARDYTAYAMAAPHNLKYSHKFVSPKGRDHNTCPPEKRIKNLWIFIDRYFDNHVKHINTPRGKTKYHIVTDYGIYNYHWAVKDYVHGVEPMTGQEIPYCRREATVHYHIQNYRY